MKRAIALLLLTALILCGCAFRGSDEDTVTFYYLRGEIQYGSDDGVIVPEKREPAVTGGDLSYLLSLYLKGPTDVALKLPLPAGTRLTEVQSEGTAVTLTFSQELARLEGMDLSIACACISYTCFSLTEAETVTILTLSDDGETPISVTVTRESFLLYDDTTREADAS